MEMFDFRDISFNRGSMERIVFGHQDKIILSRYIRGKNSRPTFVTSLLTITKFHTSNHAIVAHGTIGTPFT